MFDLGKNKPDLEQQKWRSQLDRFVIDNEPQLAALAWALKQEWGEDNNDVLGIDLVPTPHFVACASENLETLNKNTKGQLQEILGIVDGHNPELEVVMIAIGEGQLKLINFQPETPPPDCFAKTDGDVDRLSATLETALTKYIV